MSSCPLPGSESSEGDVPADKSTAKQHEPLDVSTFIFPQPLSMTTVTIEFCDRCRWLHRATWVQTELLLTFPPPTIGCISLIPRTADDTAGRFRVWLSMNSEPAILIWDRKVEGGFPELKVLKQQIRDRVQPGLSLGHSDKRAELVRVPVIL